MIRNFRSNRLKRYFERGDKRRIHADHRETVGDILARLNASASPGDMNLPGLRLYPLKGDLEGYWSVTVQANWRVIFRFEEGHAVDVDYLDYHER